MKKLSLVLITMLLTVGCQPAPSGPQGQQSPQTQSTDNLSPIYAKVEKNDLQGPNTVNIQVRNVSEAEALGTADESILELNDTEGLINFATATHSNQIIRNVTVIENGQTRRTVSIPPETEDDSNNNQNASILNTPGVVRSASVSVPPPGVSMDRSIRPKAGVNANRSQKVAAIRRVGESQLGVKYIWGANKDQGQKGFDCSNFTSYVYRHALGYKLSSVSRRQHSSVGVRVPLSDMQAGDLVTFDRGAHVGIYMGGGRMIQMGGGTGKCTYLPLKKGAYWYNHITSVKRMF